MSNSHLNFYDKNLLVYISLHQSLNLHINFDYSYENEDEIDDVIREKNIRFVEVEKKIKDIENEIKNRFNGKRDIPTIE